MLRLTPQQVAHMAQLSDQTLRHWRQVLPPLAGLNGYIPCFIPGDVLALLVLRHLVKIMGISVGTLAAASIGLFDLCRNTNWPYLAERRLLVQVERGAVSILTQDFEVDDPAIVIPMRPFADRLQSIWASSFSPADQLPFQFPASVQGPARRAGA